MNRIAFFDFDGTITTKDTLLEFIKFSKGTFRFYLGFALNSPWLLAWKGKLISNQQAKERMLTHFFSGIDHTSFQATCDLFGTAIVPDLIRPKALEEIIKLRDAGFSVVIVSASPENWIKPWADSVGATLMATRLEVKNSRITGKIEGNNCHGKEKVRRIEELYTLPDYQDIYAYGDTGGDRPMLQLATQSFFKPFR